MISCFSTTGHHCTGNAFRVVLAGLFTVSDLAKVPASVRIVPTVADIRQRTCPSDFRGFHDSVWIFLSVGRNMTCSVPPDSPTELLERVWS